MPRRKFVFVLFCLFLALFSVKKVDASIITIDNKGEVTVNVLSEMDSFELEIPQSESLELKGVADQTPDENTKISLLNNQGKIKLTLSSEQGEKTLDVTDYKDEVIEIEERPKIQKLSIAVNQGKFIIRQGEVLLETERQIEVDPESAKLTVETETGYKFLSILPKAALDSALRSKYINRFNRGKKLKLVEEEKQLAYLIEGDKVINFFDIYEYVTPVSAKISASTGEILSVEQPTWLKIISFIFV